MNREIKFRAWIEGKGMLYQGTASLASFFSTLEGSGKYHLMQYTGLKDKNNDNEIYEGDIVRHKNQYMEIDSETKWLPNQAGFSIDSRYLAETEVIGNTHENPELLK